MSTFALAGLITVLLLVLLALRIPVAYSLLISGIVGLVALRSLDYSLSATASQLFDSTASWSLVVIPLFLAMGVFARNSALATDGFELASKLLRRVPGGLPIATIFAAAGFAALNGSSVATVAAIGPISVREMRKQGYSGPFSAGIIGASGTLGVLIPPSIFLVLYGIVSGESIGEMLVAGIVPGIVTAIVFIIVIFLRARFFPKSLYEKGAFTGDHGRAPGQESRASNQIGEPAATPVTQDPDAPTPPTRLNYAGLFVKMGLLIAVVMGGIYLGLLTTIEAAAMGMAIALLIMIADRFTRFRPRTTKNIFGAIYTSFRELVLLNSMMFALIVGASVFTFFLVLARVPQSLTESITSSGLPPALILALFFILLIPMGMFLDSISILLVAIPLMHPVMTELGFDGIWFGILAVKLIELGLITPPVGLNAYVASGVSGVPITQVFKGLLWFIPVDLFLILLFVFIPQIILWLPGLMMK